MIHHNLDVRRLSAPCRAGPRRAETPEQRAQTINNKNISGRTRLGPPMISEDLTVVPPQISKLYIKTQRRTKNDGLRNQVRNINEAEKRQCHTTNETRTSNCFSPRAHKDQRWHASEGVFGA